MSERIWSPQQAAFLERAINGDGSIVLEACAGTGKTTVLLEAGAKMPGQVVYIAFNKKIVDETKGKLKAANIPWEKMQAGTAHSLGLSGYKRLRKNVRVDGNKVRTIVEGLLPDAHPLNVYSSQVVKLVSFAKQHLIGMNVVDDMHVWMELADHYDVFDDDDDERAPKEEVIEEARKALRISTSTLDVIDFDDMIYMPLVHRAPFYRFDVVMIDEAQDTNAARRALVAALVKKGGRVIAVGDRHQAIYGFTGADADSLDLIAKDFACERMPLTVSYRCPRSVVAFAQTWVGHIEAAPQALEGTVSKAVMEDFLKRNDLNGSSAILCRVTKPLVSLAFRLIRQRTPCRIEGRDIGERIKKLIMRWKVTSLDGLEDKLDKHLQRETTKLLARKQEGKLAEVEDAVETVRVIIDQCRKEGLRKVSDATSYVDSLFADNVNDILTLSTIHKAKGREWPQVFWLDRIGTCPSKWARQEWQKGQEANLCYVAATRAQETLVELAAAA